MTDDRLAPASALLRIRAARVRLGAHVHRTPLLECRSLSSLAGAALLLKCENLQRAGAFKLRGALAKATSLAPAVREPGLVTYSSGNHGQGVALAARLVGVPATVVMPVGANPAKVAAALAYGARVEHAGSTSDERRARAEEIALAHGLAMVPPFDDAEVIAGQGTVALEIVEQREEERGALGTVLVPVGGGGLVSGVALALRALAPRTRVVGVEPAGAAKAALSLAAGARVRLERTDTIADGLRPLALGELNWEVVHRHVDEVITVGDDAIREALRLLLERAKLVVEPSGAVAVAAALAHGRRLPAPLVAVLSGGNLDVSPLVASLR